MHIVWITTQFPQNKNYVNGIFIYRTVKELSKYYKISVLCLYPTFPPIFTILKNPLNWKFLLKRWNDLYPTKPTPPKDLKNVNVIYLKYPRLWRGKLLFIEGWFAYFFGKRILKNLITEDTLLHSNWIFPEGKLGMIISERFKKPYILTLRGGEVDIDNFLIPNTINWKAARNILNGADKITSVSTALIDKLRSNGLISEKHKTSITHNIYEFDKFFIQKRSDARKALNLPINEKIILYVGSLTKRKNILSLINAFDKLKEEEEPKKNLIIIGSGIEETSLKEYVAAKKIENIFFFEKIFPDKLVDYFNAADVFCLLSFKEGLPNVVIEALLCGTPVVGSSIDEIPYVIKNDINGFLINPYSLEEITDSIKKAVNINWNRETIRDSVNFLSPDKILNEYKCIYDGYK